MKRMIASVVLVLCAFNALTAEPVHPEAAKPLLDAGVERIVFIKRLTYSANHYYTEYINSRWTPGGNLCTLEIRTGKVVELVPELTGGVFGRFDLDFDARHIVFAWKSAHQEGYRLYEIQIDPKSGGRVGGLKQLTFPQKDEDGLVKMYRATGHYHHGTDDMDPCYLPDGDIVFISTRCQYGILCDSPDDFTTTVLYRVGRDGKNLKKLSNGSVSEASPTILPDGRIMYTRWEYVNKGAVSAKCLWAMKPDGSASAEIYGNDISLPPTLLYGRPIPASANQYVVLGTPHCPQNGMGTVIRLDMNKNIRTRDPMTYMTPDVDIRSEGGFSFKKDGNWRGDGSGKAGPLFKEPYPLSDKCFLVPHKAAGNSWNDPKAYDLSLLDESGNVTVIYDDPEISCFQPFPLRSRERPPVTDSPIDRKMAENGLATCIVTDIYHGMEGAGRGSIKYLRVLEQIPRPWAARRRWSGDCVYQEHAAITKHTHLGLKVQHGIVPVEEDGSAHFVVPANRNIFFQALDENHMAIQTERTFVNYIAGETRSCIGCHETPDAAAMARTTGTVKALTRQPSIPGPQPGETTGGRAIDFVADVQPVLDKHCISCHGDKKREGDLDLRGTPTAVFSTAYEQLLNIKYIPYIGENSPKTGNVHYMPARSFGSHNSLLAAILAPDLITLKDPGRAGKAAKLAEKHADLKLSREELLKITNWVDTNGQFYGMYWGRKNLQHKEHPNFRPTPTFERASSMISTIPEEER
jgi:hypothetical protein